MIVYVLTLYELQTRIVMYGTTKYDVIFVRLRYLRREFVISQAKVYDI